jgi:stage II sporulation protein AA (anti-sigma F factor antagonist)
VDFQEVRQGEAVVVAPVGSLNAQNEEAFSTKLKALLAESLRFLVVDFRKVDYVSSAALRVLLLVARKLVPREGRLVLCALNPEIQQAFTVSGFDNDFTIVTTRGEALDVATRPVTAPEPVAERTFRPDGAPIDVRIARLAALTLVLMGGDEGGAARPVLFVSGPDAPTLDPRLPDIVLASLRADREKRSKSSAGPRGSASRGGRS